MIICGIDEAGRGPVLGPMVMAVVAMEESELNKLSKYGVKDSKDLSASRRLSICKQIRKDGIKFEYIEASPEIIDEALNSIDMNLNHLEAKLASELIKKVNPDLVYMDCPSINTKAFTIKVKEYLQMRNVKIISEHKADVNYPIVSAASIIAKVIRDDRINKIKKNINKEIGSGYPSDPKTKKFLAENYSNSEYRNIIRTTWSTYRRLING